MPTQDLVTKVWIVDGCIVCDACETAAPSVFEVKDNTCIVRPAALNAEFTKPLTTEIIEAAQECPVDVIKFETQPVEISVAAVAPAPAAKAPAPPPAKTPAAPPKAPAPPPAKAPAKPAAAPVAAMAADADPTMQLLMRAAKSRGGRAGMEKTEQLKGADSPAVQRFADKSPEELPPDARQAKIIEAAKPKPEKDAPTRRDAIKIGSLAIGAGWAAFGTAAAVGFGPALGRFLMPSITEEPDPKVRLDELSKFADMAPGEVNEDYKSSKGIWIVRLDDRIAALNIICTHLGCIPNWLANDRKFKCPCHGSGYRQDGVNFEGPTPRPLERFKILVEDGTVIVDKSRKFQQELGQWDNPDSFLLV